MRCRVADRQNDQTKANPVNGKRARQNKNLNKQQYKKRGRISAKVGRNR
ncbi:MAG: hypothetical protein KIC80_03525 [Brachyspira sp.]|nr:hypothetical protein [Brachyspira sp.]